METSFISKIEFIKEEIKNKFKLDIDKILFENN
jgi:hypothetical protein